MKILMATMGLDIGGAETHIVELSKALQSQGHQILIASAGGAYVQEIREAGILHYKVPMKRRNLGELRQAYGQLREIILEEKPDVVHAHARIPGFLCGLLHKRMKFPFVTTAHWVFSTGGGLRYLTNWGQRVMAVSQDIRDYLVAEYDYPASRIGVTINGIDTQKFAPSAHRHPVGRMLEIPGHVPVLCYVSRMDQDRALVARQLIDLAEELTQAVPGIALLLVGGGDQLESLRQRAKEVNDKLGWNCIVMPGARTDISHLISLADVFVGVSRSALEAMAAGKVVIVAGNEGYQGIFTPDGLEEARAGNFCCRGMDPSTPERLKADVLAAFGLSPAAKESLGIYGRQVISQHYSVERMAQDCVEMYVDVLRPCYQVLMSGYYGFDNAGDDAILQAVQQEILAQDQGDNIQICVLSNNPKETTARYGLGAIHRFDLIGVARQMWQSDGLISGGGSLLQDRTSNRSLLYYLSIMRLAELFHKPVFLYANGIGPVTRKKNRQRVRRAVERASAITLRDQDSAQELRDMGVKREDLVVTADPVQLLTPAPEEEGKTILKEAGITGEFVVVSVRDWVYLGKFPRELAKLCDHLYSQHQLQVLFVLMQPVRDFPVSREVQRKMVRPSIILQDDISPSQLMAVLGQAKLCVAMRLHTLIFSGRMGVPLLGLVYDPKVESYLKDWGMPVGGKVADFDGETAIVLADKLLEDYENSKKQVMAQAIAKEEAAGENHRLLLELLRK